MRRLEAALAGLVAITTVIAGSDARADAASEVTLDQVMDLLRERSPELAAWRSEVGVSEADVVGARLLPNPVLGYGAARTLRGEDHIGGIEHAIELEVPLLLGGQRRARIRAAERGVTATRAAVSAQYAILAREVRHQFLALLAEQERLRLLEEAQADILEVERVVVGRADAGAASRYDVERIRTEMALMTSNLAAARAEREEAAGELARLVGVPGWRPVAVGELAPSAAPLPSWAEAEPRLPLVAAARAEEAAAQAEIELARREGFPEVAVTAGGFAFTDGHGLALLVGLAVPLPIFDRNQGAQARARAEAVRAQLTTRAIASDLKSKLDAAARALAARRAALEALEGEALSRLPILRRMAEESYRSGEGGILEFLDAVGSILETRLAHVDAVLEVMRAEVDVEFAGGRIDSDFRP